MRHSALLDRVFRITNLNIIRGVAIAALVVLTAGVQAQQQGKDKKPGKDWEGDGEIENVEIEIIKERQVALPEANRNFDKIPPRPSEPIKPPITYDFRAVNFQPPPIAMQVRPLKLKQEGGAKVYGGYLRAGYGNYVSPLLEGYYTTTRDKDKLLGIYGYHHSSMRGPIDGRNSGTGTSGLNVFGNSFSNALAFSGSAGFENRTTHFYGYPEGLDVSASSIKQAYNRFRIYGDMTNANSGNLSYKLGAGLSHMSDKFDAKETEVDLVFASAYKLNDDSRIHINADYVLLNRKDSDTDIPSRHLLTISPSYQFEPIEDLKLKVGANIAYENDTIDAKSLHVYPDISASYPLTPSVDVFASLTGGMDKVSLQTLSYENIWLAPNATIFHTNKVVDFTGGLKARVGTNITAHAGLSVGTLKNYYFFLNNTADPSKFDVVYDMGSGTRRANLFVAFGYTKSQVATFLVRGDVFDYKTGSLAEPWHRPAYKLTANASYNLYGKLLLSADVIAQGGMKGYDPVSLETVKLKGAFDLNFKVDYLFSQSFSLFVMLNNITSNQYPLFLNYPVRGFQATGGFTWSF